MFLFKHFGSHNHPPPINFGGGLLFNGLLFVFFGLAILQAPELLAYLIAILLIIFGASLLTAWWKVRHIGRN
ncbi:hypothetical protein KJ652_02880 [Patescibacteria group bacterium]|nr:hypothetical protein [Patescibacteria group bacterium]MBU1123511.1 hypothetical protein [Patescibacteria group bacterium]